MPQVAVPGRRQRLKLARALDFAESIRIRRSSLRHRKSITTSGVAVMERNKSSSRQRQEDRASTPGPLGYVAAAGLAVPVGAIAWFELVYLFFGLTGDDPPAAFSFVTAVVAFGLAFGWPLYRSHRPAEVVWRGCRLGLVVALLLPLVSIAVLFLWQNASGRRDLGMGGLMLYSLPFVALGMAAVLAIAFGLGTRGAGRRLQDRPPEEKT